MTLGKRSQFSQCKLTKKYKAKEEIMRKKEREALLVMRFEGEFLRRTMVAGKGRVSDAIEAAPMHQCSSGGRVNAQYCLLGLLKTSCLWS